MSGFRRRLTGVIATLVLAASPLLLQPTQADAAKALTCSASMSDATPEQYSNVYVRVHSAAAANVRTVAHYKTTTTTHYGKTGPAGWANIKYYISSATAGYRVYVDVYVTKSGASGHCSTSFVPHS
jgi:hypothetical protein